MQFAFTFALVVKNILKIYKRSFTDAYFFGYVSAIKKSFPTNSNDKAILNFMNEHSLTDDDVNIKTLISTYQRMQKEYFEMQKTTA